MAINDLEGSIFAGDRITRKNAGDVHHLSKPDNPFPPLKPARSSAVSTAPPASRGVAGTHEGNITRISSGVRAASASMSIPGTPQTLAISWGSATTVVVPRARTSAHICRGEERTLDMNMGIDQPGATRARRVMPPLPLIISMPMT